MSDPTISALTPADLAAYREEAASLARLGGAELRRFFAQTIEPRTKTSGRDLVTEADLASERVILAAIEVRHPGHGWQSEEAGSKAGASPLRWVIDPLDGTGNFAHGYPQFCVSVALLHGERSVAGAIYDPLRDECFEAALGAGATLNGRPIRVSPVTTLAGSLVSTGFPYEPPERRSAIADLTARTIERVQFLRRGGSAALDLAYVAAGRAEVHWEFHLQLHDIAVGMLLIVEAGGRADHIRYADWPSAHMGANGDATHAAMIDLIQTYLGPLSVTTAQCVADEGA